MSKNNKYETKSVGHFGEKIIESIHAYKYEYCSSAEPKVARKVKGITQTRQCNIQQYFMAVKMFIFR